MSEEDLEVLEEKLKQWQPYKNKKWETAIESCIARENQAIENLIKSYKQEKEKNKEYEQILDIWDNRKYRKRYLEERRKEQPNLLYPDADEIYQKYYEEKEKNKELETENFSLNEMKRYNKKHYIHKDKIKEVFDRKLKNIVCEKVEVNYNTNDIHYQYWDCFESVLLNMKKELLEE